MKEPPTAPPLRRPVNARLRTDSAEAIPPPSADELAAIERQLVELPRFAGASVTEEAGLGAVLVRHTGRGPGANFAAAARWAETDVPERLARVAARMRADGEWPVLMVADGVSEPAGLGAALRRAGWVALERERVMWTRRPPVVPHLDPSTRLEALTRRSAAEYIALEQHVFGLLEGFAHERTEGLIEAVERREMRAFLVRLHGELVAVARLALGERVAGIYGVAVAPERRRQGFGALVTAIATRSALATGDRIAWLSVSESNEPAVRLYTALGYRPSFSWARWLAPVGG